jgi:hypothetical protein
VESISLYNDIIGDAKTRNMTKAYLRDHFLNNLDEGLPTYSANKRTYKNKEHVFKTIFSPEEQEMADKIHEYLKNRHKGTSKLAAIGSPTSGRSYTKKEITDYLGEKTHTPYTALGDLPIIRKLPFIPKRLKGITVPNKKSLLNQLCKFSHKYLKFYPQILSKNEPWLHSNFGWA